MPPTFTWDNFEDIAIALADKFPDTDPLTVRFTDMHKWITELPGFSGDPAASNEAKLEAIQMAWHEEFQLWQHVERGRFLLLFLFLSPPVGRLVVQTT